MIALKRSFASSAHALILGSIDGTVSLLGLIAGLASSTANSHVILLAGCAAAGSEAVSMGVGEYLADEGSDGEHAALIHAVWMFLASGLAGAVPVLPFAVFDYSTARIGTVITTVLFLTAIGLGRARIGSCSPRRSVLETLLTAGAAAAVGLAIGILINQ